MSMYLTSLYAGQATAYEIIQSNAGLLIKIHFK